MNLVERIQLDSTIEYPSIICSKKDTFFICSDESNKIYQVDKTFKILNQFSSNVYKTCSAISCDTKSDSSVVYTTHENENKVLKWDYAQGKVLQSVQIQQPDSLCYHDGHVYVTSICSYQTDSGFNILSNS